MFLSLSINADHLHISEEKLKKLKINLNSNHLNYRFVPKERLQIKLLSLGHFEKENIPELKVKIKKIIEVHRGFELKLSGILAYPNQKQARLLWIGVQNSIALRALNEELAKNLISPHNFREDKLFRPVLPIVRLKNHHDVSDMISPYKGSDFGKLKVTELILYDMVSGGAFPQYDIVEKFILPKSEPPHLAMPG